MRAGQQADHRLDRADLIELAAVNALAVLEDGAANDFRFQLLDRLVGDHLRLRFFFGEGFLGLGPRIVERIRTRRLVGQLVGGGDVVADDAAQLFLDRRGIVRSVDFPRFLGGLLGQVDDRADDLAAFLMREHDGAEHFLFGQFLGFGFDHHHRVLRCGNDEVEATFFVERAFEARVEFVFAIAETDACSTDRAHEGHARDGQRSRSGDHRDDIGLGLAVIRQDLADHVDFVVETFGEQRPYGAVDETRGERFFLRGAAFALEEAAGNAARSGEFFLVVDGQREEVLPFAYTLGGGHGAQHHGFAIGGQNGAVSLTGDAAGFEGEGLSAPLQRYGFRVEHVFSL